MGDLGRLVKLLRGDQSVPAAVHDEDFGDAQGLALSFFNSRSQRQTKETWLPRASGIYDCCIRQNVLCTLHEKVGYGFVTLRDAITFGFGNAIHVWVQNTDELILDRRGYWLCLQCRTLSKFGPKPKACKKCKGDRFLYEEAELQEGALPITGHPDLFIKRGGPIRLVELKTISERGFNDLSFAPLVSHQWQVLSYMMLLDDPVVLPGVKIDTSAAYVIYFSKGTAGREFPAKAFIVERSEIVEEDIRLKLAQYSDGIKTGELPEQHRECAASYDCWRAKRCPCLKECLQDVRP